MDFADFGRLCILAAGAAGAWGGLRRQGMGARIQQEIGAVKALAASPERDECLGRLRGCLGSERFVAGLGVLAAPAAATFVSMSYSGGQFVGSGIAGALQAACVVAAVAGALMANDPYFKRSLGQSIKSGRAAPPRGAQVQQALRHVEQEALSASESAQIAQAAPLASATAPEGACQAEAGKRRPRRL